MLNILLVEKLVGITFKILNGFPTYITLEQKKNPAGFILEQDILSLIDLCSRWGLERIGVSLEMGSPESEYISELFLRNGFEYYSSRVEVSRDLKNLKEWKPPFKWASIANSFFSETDFKQLWEKCMAGSDNKDSSLTMDQHLMSVKSELGVNWENSCRVYFLQNHPIGISIPHIEPGTTDEGRLFYFGLLPKMRRKGLSSAMHLQSLWALKEMGASYYIGSTDIANKKMQGVFEKNGCVKRSQTETYYKYFSMKKGFF
ncbi:GNAT family N-acetyltransferase [Neobacillus sp. NPDC097160]|uniref:GNAT family N-acetyltransferase n=1 Tax=Neobacillus sp. NPDC097160 TaxID=3364298 RepID=UPI003830D105